MNTLLMLSHLGDFTGRGICYMMRSHHTLIDICVRAGRKTRKGYGSYGMARR